MLLARLSAPVKLFTYYRGLILALERGLVCPLTLDSAYLVNSDILNGA